MPRDEAGGDRLPPGLPPLFLTIDQAAAYAGVCRDVFLAEVEAGLWPAPVARGAKGGKRTWHREAMEAAARALAAAGRPPQPAAPPPANDAPPLAPDDATILETLRAPRPHRPQRRHPQAA